MKYSRKRTMSEWMGLGFVCLSLLLGIFLSQSGFAAQSKQQNAMRTTIEAARNAWVRQDTEALVQLFTPDGVLIVPGQRWEGHDRIRESINRFTQSSSNVRIEIKRMIVEGNQAAVEWYYQDVETATGNLNRADDVIVVDFAGDRISQWREYFDTETPSRG
jgi:uncharacterized protein (TIGR02246 family)